MNSRIVSAALRWHAARESRLAAAAVKQEVAAEYSAGSADQVMSIGILRRQQAIFKRLEAAGKMLVASETVERRAMAQLIKACAKPGKARIARAQVTPKGEINV